MAFDLKILQEKWIAPLLLIVTGFSTWYYNKTENEIQQQTKILSIRTIELENSLKKKTNDREFKFKMFNEVKAALKSNDSIEQRILVTFINEMLLEDSTLRTNLLNIIKTQGAIGAVSQVKTIQEEERKFDSILKAPKLDSSKCFKIQIFYVEERMPESKTYALRAESELSKNKNFQVTVSMLPKAVNARAGYRISANEIRFEENERQNAEQILEILQTGKVFPLEEPRLKEINFKSPKSVSVFVNNM